MVIIPNYIELKSCRISLKRFITVKNGKIYKTYQK